MIFFWCSIQNSTGSNPVCADAGVGCGAEVSAGLDMGRGEFQRRQGGASDQSRRLRTSCDCLVFTIEFSGTTPRQTVPGYMMLRRPTNDPGLMTEWHPIST